MRMSRFDWSVRVVKNSMVRFERTRNDDSRRLHILDEVLWVACMLVHVVQTVLDNLTIIKLRFVFLNFSFVCQNNLRWSKTR